MNILIGFGWGVISSIIPGIFSPILYPFLLNIIGIEGIIICECTSLILENVRSIEPKKGLGDNVTIVREAEDLFNQGLAIVGCYDGAVHNSLSFITTSFILWCLLASGIPIKLEWEVIMNYGIPLVIGMWIIQIIKSNDKITALIVLISLGVVSYKLGERGGAKIMIILSVSLFTIPFYFNWFMSLFFSGRGKNKIDSHSIIQYEWDSNNSQLSDGWVSNILLGCLSTAFIGLPPSVIASTFNKLNEINGWRRYNIVKGAAKASSIILALMGLSKKDTASEFIYISNGIDIWLLLKILIGAAALLTLLIPIVLPILVNLYSNHFERFIHNPLILLIGLGINVYNLYSIEIGLELLPILCIGFVISHIKNIEGGLKLSGISLMPYVSLLR